MTMNLHKELLLKISILFLNIVKVISITFEIIWYHYPLSTLDIYIEVIINHILK